MVTHVVRFTRDLRVDDHPVLTAAVDGAGYPAPIVDHGEARGRFLAARGVP